MGLQEGGLNQLRHGRQRLGERRRQRWSRDEGGYPRSIDPGGELGQEHGHRGPPRGQKRLLGLGTPCDEPLESEAAQIRRQLRPRGRAGRALP
jgi:hypothetical protein